jgi:hypothetical protein
MNKVKVGNRPTEKILVTIETKREHPNETTR